MMLWLSCGLSAPPDSLATIGWCLLLRREGREGEKGKKGMGRKKGGRGGEGEKGKENLHPTLFLGPAMVHAFVTNRFDYCNSVFHHVSVASVQPLQNVLNAAARIILRKRKIDHITTDVHDRLHWLPTLFVY